MKITGVTIDWTKNRKRLSIDLKFVFYLDGLLRFSLANEVFRFEVKRVQLNGKTRVIFEPILDRPPFFGAMVIYFSEEPEIHITFTDFSKLANLSFINKFVTKKFIEFLGMLFIKPTSVIFPMALNFNATDLNYKKTVNILRIYILEAEGFSTEDFTARTLNSYVAISSAKQRARTSVATNSLNPRWHQAFEMAFNDIPEQEIVFQLFEDRLFKDELLGSCRISVKEAMKDANLDIWLPFDNAAPGRLHIRSQRLNLASDPAELRKVLLVNQMSQPVQIKEFSSAVLHVHVKRARDIKMTVGNKMPTTLIKISVRDITKFTLYHINTTDPEWNEAFSFLIKDPYTEEVQLMVEDRYHGSLGSVSVPICRLLMAENLTITDWFQLGRLEPCGALRVTLELKILVTPLPIGNYENQKSKVSSSQQPKHKTVNKPKAAPKFCIKRRPPFRKNLKKLHKPERLPKAATGGETTSDTEQPEIWRQTNVRATSTNSEEAGEKGEQPKKTIMQKVKAILRAIRTVCNK
ncbi:extended synaptotagmin-1-like [Xenopus laevis]|uniref:Extended synaptotagmin-1-like n=1 Tax=Xenopus laevis TaxID=8355 RepID=A0A8J1LHL8_XENLA|nr:extended synaptotagmin-1-like [Xenopus laevis]